MNKTIYKYNLDSLDVEIEMPEGAEILCVQTQHEKPCIWALVDPNAKLKTRYFEIFGTGFPVPSVESRNYIGTYQLQSGALVFHCFELIRL